MENISSSDRNVEAIYQKKSQLEHILLRPDTYIGSIESECEPYWVLDIKHKNNKTPNNHSDDEDQHMCDESDGPRMIYKKINIVPGLYKIFDEILVNAADNKQRDKNMDTLRVDVDAGTCTIRVWNNGAGIPVVLHREHGVYVPELIFGQLLTSSNYNDNEKKTTGGRNGYGAKLANIFSTSFEVQTYDSKNSLHYTQSWSNNMSIAHKPVIKSVKSGKDFTCVTFQPDLSRFGMKRLDDDIVALFYKRVYDIAGTSDKSLKVFLNGEQVKIKNFQDYLNLYVHSSEGGDSAPRVYEQVNDRWEVALSVSDGHFQQVSFVNNISTAKGGTHVNYIADQLCKVLGEHISKKHKSVSKELKPAFIKNHLFLFVNALIENPTFDSQTKVNLTSKKQNFGSTCELSEKFIKNVLKSGIVENILQYMNFKQSKDLKKNDGKKNKRISGIPKLDDANEAGGKQGHRCTLILTEGDSAKALAVSGLSVVGRDYYGVFPLKGKLLNVRDASHKQIMENTEVNAIKQILGLQHGKTYKDCTELRYGHIMIMADQDHDGSHIKGLVINLFAHFWPSLLKLPGFITEFITPIVKCSRGTGSRAESICFYTLPQYEQWKRQHEDGKGWCIKYYKGLGTSTSLEAKGYFSEIDKHQIDFQWLNTDDDRCIDLAFSKSKADARKEWLSEFQPGTFLDQNVKKLSYSSFVNQELILFSVASNLRAIPSVVDGLKPGQRKILFCCFKRKLTKEIKVAQLAGYVSENSAYHHGEASLASTIIGLAQNFVGSNNINLLIPSGQFGTRLQGGKDAASPRYIFTSLAPITRALFSAHDDTLLNYLCDDGQSIEPEWYIPIIPTVLVNGSSGIGTGWSSTVPNYNPRQLISALRSLLSGEYTSAMEMPELHPWFQGFNGVLKPKGANNYVVKGIIERVDDCSIHISELPIQKWTGDYKDLLEAMLAGGEIKDFKEHHTDTTVSFLVTMTPEQFKAAEAAGLYKKFKLTSSLSTTNMVLFDQHGKLKKYNSANEVLLDFYELRKSFYHKRKQALVEQLKLELLKLSNKVRFIKAVISDEFKLRNVKKSVILQRLVADAYTAFPKKAKAKVIGEVDDDDDSTVDESTADEESVRFNSYDYLLSMPLWSLTAEKVNALLNDHRSKESELNILQATSIESMWLKDLDELEIALSDHEERQRKADAESAKVKSKKSKSVESIRGIRIEDDADDDKPVVARKPKAVVESSAGDAAAASSGVHKKSKPRRRQSESDEDEDLDSDEQSEQSDNEAPIQPREAAPRRAAAAQAMKKTAALKEESDGEFDDDDASDADQRSSVVKAPSRAACMRDEDEDDDDDDFESSQSESDYCATPVKKAKSQPKSKQQPVQKKDTKEKDNKPVNNKKKSASTSVVVTASTAAACDADSSDLPSSCFSSTQSSTYSLSSLSSLSLSDRLAMRMQAVHISPAKPTSTKQDKKANNSKPDKKNNPEKESKAKKAAPKREKAEKKESSLMSSPISPEPKRRKLFNADKKKALIDILAATPKAAAKPKKGKKQQSDDEEEYEPTAVAANSRPKRATKPIKYAESESEDEEDDDEDDISEIDDGDDSDY